MESVLTLKTWITPVEGDDTKAISLQNWNQSTVKLFNQNVFISIRSCLLSFKQSRLVLKAAGLVSFDCPKFYMNFTKDFLVLCEIIERHEGKSIIAVVNFFIVGLSYSMHQSMDDTVLTVMVCAWTSVKYLITLLILINYIGHFFAFKFWLLTLKMCFSKVSVNFLIAVLTVSACIF